MKTKFFYPNIDGNIEFTRTELEKLLNDVYDEGREAGKREAQPYIINFGNEPAPVSISPTFIYNNTTGEPLWNTNKIYCTDDNSIGRITLELDTIGE